MCSNRMPRPAAVGGRIFDAEFDMKGCAARSTAGGCTHRELQHAY